MLRRRTAAAGLAVGLAVAGCSSGSGRSSAPPTTEQAPASTTGSTVARPAPPAAASWSTYQNGNARLGDATGTALPTPLHVLWKAPLDGRAVYGQPLYVDGRVVVATEGDDVYALDGRTGSVAWKVSIGDPLVDVTSQTGCGDIDPLGITSTPVVDPATGIVYAVGETSTGGSAPVHHVLVGVDLASGRVVSEEDVDPAVPAGENVVHLLQRPALTLGNGRLYIGYGGQAGDCGTYHGWVVAVPLAGAADEPGQRAPGEVSFDVTPQSTGGAVWGGGAGPSIAADGDVYVTTGNPNSSGPAPWSEAVLQLSAALGSAPLASFQDRAATGDLDLSTGTADLLPDGDVFAVGKTDIGYLLRASGLSEVATIRGVCGSNPDGGSAFDSVLDTLYVPCRSGGIQEIDLATHSLGWRSGSVNSTPILVGGDLWAAAYPGGTIEEMSPATGQVLYRTSAGSDVPTFVSASSAGGLLLVPTVAGVEAFTGSG